MQGYPLPTLWGDATSRQIERATRSFAILRRRGVPVYPGRLVAADDFEVRPQSPDAVVRRVVVLLAVALRAKGASRRDAGEIIAARGVRGEVSPAELRLLSLSHLKKASRKRLAWRFESIWTLLWCLGEVERLGWPCARCDLVAMRNVLQSWDARPDFIETATLRPLGEILDQLDLTLRLHWAIRDAVRFRGDMLPHNLDWALPNRIIPAAGSQGARIVAERHYTLNWVTNVMGSSDWDGVDTYI